MCCFGSQNRLEHSIAILASTVDFFAILILINYFSLGLDCFTTYCCHLIFLWFDSQFKQESRALERDKFGVQTLDRLLEPSDAKLWVAFIVLADSNLWLLYLLLFAEWFIRLGTIDLDHSYILFWLLNQVRTRMDLTDDWPFGFSLYPGSISLAVQTIQ